jgi:pimeloyl-ACP methyl ester carboxylesterase
MLAAFGFTAYLAVGCVLAGDHPEQTHPLWCGLQQGPHAVGFRVIWAADGSRTWAAPGAARPRPLRITVWYPARATPGLEHLRFRDYVSLKPPDTRFADVARQLEQADMGAPGLGGVRGFFKSKESVALLMGTLCAALLEAPAAEGRFPLVVHSLGQNDYTQENVVLFEYLASHGYVVATVPHLGTSPHRFNLYIDDPRSYEAQVRDLEYIIASLGQQPFVDGGRVAAMGHSMGGVYALWLAMRHQGVRALVGLDPSFVSKPTSYHYKYWESPWFDRARAKIPMLVLYKKEGFDSAILDQLGYSDRHLIEFPRLTHGDFNSAPMVMSLAPADSRDEYALKMRTPAEGILGHHLVCHHVQDFLDAVLGRDRAVQSFRADAPPGVRVPEGFEVYRHRKGMDAPTEEEFFVLIQEHGLPAALERYRQAAAAYPGQEIVREKLMNRIGYEQFWASRPVEALDVFRFNAESHPRSENAYDSLAEGFLAVGDKEGARRSYGKVLEINSANQNAIQKLRELKD